MDAELSTLIKGEPIWFGFKFTLSENRTKPGGMMG